MYYDVMMNIDAVAQEALVNVVSGTKMSVALEPAKVESIASGKLRYVGVGPGEAIPEGFYQVFGHGREHVYKAVRKRIASSPNNMNGDPIGYEDPYYRQELTRYFGVRYEY